jgi:iron complex outermembrane receptor protein
MPSTSSRKNYWYKIRIHAFLICCLLLNGYNISAQVLNDSTQLNRLNNVEVKEKRSSVESLQSIRIVTIVTKRNIETSPVQDINELLRFTPGIDIRQRGAAGAQADLSIRGGTYDQTMILLNGINITDPQTGHHNLNLPVEPESIESIEILQGPATKFFGPSAFSGAVNIITGNSSGRRINAGITAGAFGYDKVFGNASYSGNRLSHFISLSNTNTDGYTDNTDYKNTSAFYQAKYKARNDNLSLQAGFNRKAFGANSFYSLKYPDQFESLKNVFAGLSFSHEGSVELKSDVYVRGNTDHFELKRGNDSIPFNNHHTITSGFNFSAKLPVLGGTSTIGLDIRRESIESNVLGEEMNDFVRVPGYEDAFYTREYSRIYSGLFLNHYYSSRKFSLNAGLLAHYNSNLNRPELYPGIDLNYAVTGRLRVYSSVNKSLRMPTFTDMFYKSPVQQGNIRLQPEKAVSSELGIKYSGSFLKADLNVFRREGSNMIDWVKDPSPDSLIWHSMNRSNVNFTGLEFSLMLRPEASKLIRTISFSYSYLSSDKESGSLISKYALDYLRHQVNITTDLRLIWKISGSAGLTYRASAGIFQDVNGEVKKYDPSLLCDARIYYKSNIFKVFAEGSNIFNIRYFDYGGILQPGIWLKAGISIEIDY